MKRTINKINPRMLRYKKNYSTCLHKRAVDLTHGKGEHRNWWCPHCETRWFKHIERNPDEWDSWIEEPI